MKRLAWTVFAYVFVGTLSPLSAQDLTITNARIVVGNGNVIERGSIVVRAGKIVARTSEKFTSLNLGDRPERVTLNFRPGSIA